MSKPNTSDKTYAVAKTEAEWRAELDEDRKVLREAATERAWTGDCSTKAAPASTPAPRATPSCSRAAPNSTPGADGRASTTR